MPQANSEIHQIFTRLFLGIRLNQFQSRDPFPGYLRQPQSLNGYSYVKNNPVIYIDLTGRVWEIGGPTTTSEGRIRYDPGTSPVYWPVAEIETIKELLPAILGSAQRHNIWHSNMDDTSFAALMITILHWEGRLEGNAKPNTLGNLARDEGADAAMFLGFYDATTGVANIRPSVALELHREGYNIEGSDYNRSIEETSRQPRLQTPGSGLSGLDFGLTNCIPSSFEFLAIELQNVTLSIEYLAANLERGVNRVRSLGFEPSAFNLAAWHNSGLQTPGQIDISSKGPKAVSYANTIIGTMNEAFPFVGSGVYLVYNAKEKSLVDANNR
jgi:hypothetical protein